MYTALIAAVFASTATAYLIGYAFVAPREAFVRTRFGIYVLVAMGLTFMLLPPQMTSLDALTGALGAQLPPAIHNALGVPEGFSPGVYLAVWIVLLIAGFLAGLRVWDAGKPGWRPGTRATSESAVERVQGLLPLAGSLDEVFEMLAKSPLSMRDIEFIEPQLLLAGARFSAQLPDKRSDAFSMVSKRVPMSIAVRVTELLQQGAAEKTSAR
jgi:hypothetical protein